MTTRALTLTALGGLLLAGCSLPPANFPIQPITVPYNTFVPGAANGVPFPTIPAFNAVNAPATSIPVPSAAKSVTLSTLILNLQTQNNGPLPLVINLYLSPASVDPYTTQPLGSPINLAANGPQATNSFTLDPSLAKQDSLKLGFSVSSPGSTQPVTFESSNNVVVQGTISAQVKVF